MLAAALLLCLAFMQPLFSPGRAAGQQATTNPELLAHYPLPHFIRYAWDVRWHGVGRIAVAAGLDGVVRLDLDQLVRKKLLIEAGEKVQQPGFAYMLARTVDWVISASPIAVVTWSDRKGPVGSFPFNLVADIDMQSDGTILVFGAEKPSYDNLAPDGVFLRSLQPAPSKGDELPEAKALDLQALWASSPGGEDFARCHRLELGALRMLDDDSYILVPGFEPNVLWYSADDQLLRQWSGAEVGLEDLCSGVSESESNALGMHPEKHFAWLDRYTVLDDIIPMPQGPALLLRRVEDGKVGWFLRLLLADGSGTRDIELPAALGEGANMARMKGDVDGDQLLLLRTESGTGESPPVRPRVFLLSLSPAEKG